MLSLPVFSHLPSNAFNEKLHGNNRMTALKNSIKSMNRESAVFSVAILVCTACIMAFLYWYFSYYAQPYMQNKIVDLSEGWHYDTPFATDQKLDSLRTGPKLGAGETMTLYRTLDVLLPQAAILIRANHQSVVAYLDDIPLHADPLTDPGANPGMALHFLTLPEDYHGKTLKIQLTSPYALYSGRTSSILLGTVPSLEAFTLSASMRPLFLMAVCLFLGFCVLSMTLIQAMYNYLKPQNLCLGVFAVIWALYYVCTEYVVFQFFDPFLVSTLSLSLYFSFQVPLALFFYFSFEHFRKWMLPAVIVHCGFATVAIVLQLAGIMDLPRLVNLNNILLTGLVYTIALAVLEASRKNRMMMLTLPFFIIAYFSMLWNFWVFYGRSGVVPYSYRDTYFLLVLCILMLNVKQFFQRYFRNRHENEFLAIQNRQAMESYRQMKEHLGQIDELKHELKNHIISMQLYLKDGQYQEATDYLEAYAGHAMPIVERHYHENFLINSIESGLRQRALEAGVNLHLNLKAAPVRIAAHDFYALVSNMLDNALEACVAMPGDQERFIRLVITRREPYLNVRCVNSRSGEVISVEGKIQTTKRSTGHGYGLWTIERIVEAYDGIIDIDYDEDTFTVMAALKDQ